MSFSGGYAMKKFAALALVLFVGTTFAEDKKESKIEADKLVGKWELTKGPDEVPKGMVIELTKDGKLTATFEFDGKKVEMTGTYKLDGAKLSHKVKGPDGMEHEDDDTITTLTDEKMVMIDKDKKETEWKKKK